MRGLRGSLRRAARLFMSHARDALAASVAIVGALARREERFPRNASRIVDPRFFRLGVAAASLPLLDHVAARPVQARVNFIQLVLIFDLDAEMIEARLFAARRDRKI